MAFLRGIVRHPRCAVVVVGFLRVFMLSYSALVAAEEMDRQEDHFHQMQVFIEQNDLCSAAREFRAWTSNPEIRNDERFLRIRKNLMEMYDALPERENLGYCPDYRYLFASLPGDGPGDYMLLERAKYLIFERRDYNFAKHYLERITSHKYRAQAEFYLYECHRLSSQGINAVFSPGLTQSLVGHWQYVQSTVSRLSHNVVGSVVFRANGLCDLNVQIDTAAYQGTLHYHVRRRWDNVVDKDNELRNTSNYQLTYDENFINLQVPLTKDIEVDGTAAYFEEQLMSERDNIYHQSIYMKIRGAADWAYPPVYEVRRAPAEAH